MFNQLVCGALAASLLLAAPAAAAQPAASPKLAFAMSASARPGEFVHWDVKDLTGLSGFEAETQFRSFAADPKWPPGLKLILRSGERSVMLGVAGREGETLRLYVEEWEGRMTRISKTAFRTAPPSNAMMVLGLRWTPEGKVVASVGDLGGTRQEQLVAQLAGPAMSLSVNVSTADVRFPSLRLLPSEP